MPLSLPPGSYSLAAIVMGLTRAGRTMRTRALLPYRTRACPAEYWCVSIFHFRTCNLIDCCAYHDYVQLHCSEERRNAEIEFEGSFWYHVIHISSVISFSQYVIQIFIANIFNIGRVSVIFQSIDENEFPFHPIHISFWYPLNIIEDAIWSGKPTSLNLHK